MRKLKFLTMAAAMFAAGLFLTACSSSDNNVTIGEVTIPADCYSIYAFSNQKATFTVDVTADETLNKDQKSAYFTGIGLSNTTVKVTATLVNGEGFVTSTQTAIVNFSDQFTCAAIGFDFEKKPTVTKSQAEVAASTDPIVLSTSLSGMLIEMILPGGTTVTDGGDDPFSIAAYWHAATIFGSNGSEGQTLLNKVIVLSTTPAGTLSTDGTIKMNVGQELAGETLTITKGDEKVSAEVQEDGTVEFKVNSLGDWILVFDPLCIKKTVGTEVLHTYKTKIYKGENTYDINRNVGCEFKGNGLIAAYIEATFGKTHSKKEETGYFDCDKSTSGVVVVSQHYIDYTFQFGKVAFDVRVWGNVFTKIDVDGNAVIKGHSGGGGH